ncbi:hypothetical protein EYC80_004109 [Monilinia laxa]|uniref:Uncharacterized protein n=1 Tax=Monilinia laxa TaxID=61186 RepID=A0A5N6KMA0_MONLA|nr:hypothetical protein EYC80_004109 [Monilinia laxa]
MPKMKVDPENYRVEADGVHIICEAADWLPLGQNAGLGSLRMRCKERIRNLYECYFFHNTNTTTKRTFENANLSHLREMSTRCMMSCEKQY